MNWQIKLADPAREDIRRALQYTLDRFGQMQHDDYKALIRMALIDIATSPLEYPAKKRPELSPGVLTFPCQLYAI